MSIVSVCEIWDDRQTSVDEAALVTRTRTWRVVVDNVQHDDLEVVNEFSRVTGINRYVPWVSIRGNVDSTVRASSLTAKQDSDAWTWIVTVQYTSGRAGSGGGTADPRQQRERAAMARQNAQTGEPPSQNPTGRPLVIRWGSQEYQEALTTDVLDTRTVMNSALQPYVPVPMRTLSYRTLTIERNQLSYDPVATWDYENTVNDARFYGFPEKSVLCKSITADFEFESGISFWRVTYVFWIRYPDWMVRIADMGVNELDGVDALGNAKYKRIPDRLGGFVSSPVPLDGKGRKLANPRQDKIVYTPYNQYLTAHFQDLGIGG